VTVTAVRLYLVASENDQVARHGTGVSVNDQVALHHETEEIGNAADHHEEVAIARTGSPVHLLHHHQRDLGNAAEAALPAAVHPAVANLPALEVLHAGAGLLAEGNEIS
jgi:hypothetical protein